MKQRCTKAFKFRHHIKNVGVLQAKSPEVQLHTFTKYELYDCALI